MKKNLVLYVLLFAQSVNSLVYVMELYKSYVYFILISLAIFFISIIFRRIYMKSILFIIINSILTLGYLIILAMNSWEGINPMVQAYFIIFIQFNVTFTMYKEIR
jgi:hypothetical protein